MSKFMEKSWLSPFLLITYIATSVTGILMLFHIKFPGLYPVHEWGGLIFILAGILHTVINWKMLTSYFNKNKQKRNAVMATFIAIFSIILIAVSVPSNKHSHSGNFHANTSSTLPIDQG